MESENNRHWIVARCFQSLVSIICLGVLYLTYSGESESDRRKLLSSNFHLLDISTTRSPPPNQPTSKRIADNLVGELSNTVGDVFGPVIIVRLVTILSSLSLEPPALL